MSRSRYDILTGLLTYEAFIISAEEFFNDYYDRGLEPVMIFFDLTGVKPFIARYGETEGERLLRGFSDLLRKYFGNERASREDTFSFYAFCENKGLDEIIPALIKDMKGLSEGNTVPIKVGVFHDYKKGRDNMKIVTGKARFASLTTGRNNRSGISYFDDRMDEELDLKTFVVEKIDEAIREGHIKIYYQSKLRLLNDKFCGAEAFTRWEDPKRGFLYPSDYIPILEEKNLTWKIDTYVLREVAKNIKRCTDLKLEPLPISVNLTYADFLVLDVPDTVRGIIEDNDIDRSLLAIEVTEKTVLRDPDLLREEIEKLHEHKINVYIDDFGNGYSSINMLSDFRFDGIKIDMEFMSSFNERSKKIVESIVVMAKNLKIHTISEGVETREQLEFLRSIGCEEVQGYYFGNVRTFDETVKGFINDSFLERENAGERELFSKAGLINTVTDQALALIYFDNKDFDVFYANNEFYRLISRTGHDPFSIMQEMLKHAENTNFGKFRVAAERVRESGAYEDVYFSFNGIHYLLEVSLTANNGTGCIFKGILTEAATDPEEADNMEMEVFRDLLSSYNNIYEIDLITDSIKVIRADYGRSKKGSSYDYEKNIQLFVESGTVFPADIERFVQTFDTRNLKERFSGISRGAVLNVFRLKVDGVFKWASIRIFAVPDSDGKKLICCITVIERSAQADFVEMSRRVTDHIGVLKESSDPVNPIDGETLNEAFLWNSLMEVADIKYFWKDNDRRFLGASQSFLDFYGFDSVQRILGKNDEEMGWHPDDTKYRSDELDVIEKGVIIRNSPGQIYAKGAKINILATKYPLYRNGHIVGLIGYFMDTDAVLSSDEEMDHALFVDVESGLLNSRGLFLTLQGLDDNYRHNGTPYAVCTLEIAEYQRIYAEEGKKNAEKLNEMAGNAIKRTFSDEAIIAKTGACAFTVCEKSVSLDGMEKYAAEAVEKLKVLKGDNELTVISACAGGNEKASMHEVMALLHLRLNENKKKNGENREEEEEIYELPDIFTDLPLPFIITRPVFTLNGTTDVKYVFVNNKYCEYTGLSRLDIVGKSYRDSFEELPDWIGYSGRAANGQIVTGRVYDVAFGEWMEYISAPSSIPGCCNTVFWPVEDTKNERDLLTRGHAADNAIIRIARFLNKTGEFETAVYNSLSELGRVLNPDRVYVLDSVGVPLYEWCADGVMPRSRRDADSINFNPDNVRYARIEDNCIVVEDVELYRKIDPANYDFLVWEGIRSYMLVPLYDNDSRVMGFVGVDNYDKDETSDTRRLLEEISYFISSRMIANRLVSRLNRMSNRDELTGLLNRHGFHGELDKYLMENPDDTFTIVLIDVDDFKIVNDMYGHATGDQVLRNLADDLNEIFGDKAIIARTGGDEISLAILNMSAEDSLPYIRELSEMEHRFEFEGRIYTFKLSMGYAEYPLQSDELSLLLQEADSALYNVKSEGKHGYKQFSPDIKLTKRLQLAFNVKNVARYVPGAILVYKADKNDKKILYANDELIHMFDCDNLEDFIHYTKGSFDGIVHPDEIETVDKIIWDQIDPDRNRCKDYVDYRIITKKGKVKEVIDCGRYVDSEFYGKVFYVMLLDKDEWKRSKGGKQDE